MAKALTFICAMIGLMLSQAAGLPTTTTRIKLGLAGMEYPAFLNKSLYAVKLNQQRNSHDYNAITDKIRGQKTVTVKLSSNSPNTERQLVSSTVLGSLGFALNGGTTDTNVLIPLKGNMMKQPIKKYKSNVKSNSITIYEDLKKLDKSNARRYLSEESRRVANTVIPNAEQLDMAPARGAHVEDMRVKSKFCQRHVLWPEGPKYDSKGNTILPMYLPRLHNGKDFIQTVVPRFVLPRCCNCCKKSVLGCQ